MADVASPPGDLLDLGSGGGLPGLVVALVLPGVSHRLLEAGSRRAAWLRRAVEEAGLRDRVEVLEARAEEAARRRDLRSSCDAVTARAFGPPAVTAECAAGFLRPGGRLVVSEPPEGDPGRWPAGPLRLLGFGPAEKLQVSGFSFVSLPLAGAVPEHFPRRVGVPAKRPLF